MNYNIEKKDIGLLLKCINNKIICSLNKELEVFDITLMQAEVLGYMYTHHKEQDIFQKQIEEFFNSSNPTITGILKRLEAKNLIERRPSATDGRYKKLTLTDKGVRLINQLAELGPKRLEVKITKKLSGEEKDELERLLTLVLEGLEE